MCFSPFSPSCITSIIVFLPISPLLHHINYTEKIPVQWCQQDVAAGAPLQELYPHTAAQEEEERAEALHQAARYRPPGLQTAPDIGTVPYSSIVVI